MDYWSIVSLFCFASPSFSSRIYVIHIRNPVLCSCLSYLKCLEFIKINFFNEYNFVVLRGSYYSF